MFILEQIIFTRRYIKMGIATRYPKIDKRIASK